MQQIKVSAENTEVGILFKEADTNRYVFNYHSENKQISLIMPCKLSSYTWANKLHPIFDMYMPEGYLFELFKNLLAKEYGYVDDYLIFNCICPNIESRLTFKSEYLPGKFPVFDLEEIISVGKRMLNIWRISLDEKTYKEVPHEFA